MIKGKLTDFAVDNENQDILTPADKKMRCKIKADGVWGSAHFPGPLSK
jgi:hypothetical protein